MAEFVCYELLDEGNWRRGRRVDVLGVHTPEHAAQQAAENFSDWERFKYSLGYDDVAGETYHIEVEGHGAFAVRAHVELKFSANPIEARIGGLIRCSGELTKGGV